MTMKNNLELRVPGRLFFVLILFFLGFQYWNSISSEPFFNNDETRHLMTGVFFRDFLHDLPLSHIRNYTVDYYLKYPALGLLVWPPLFYMIEGAVMLIFGTSFLTGKVLILAFACLVLFYLFQLARRTQDSMTALFGCALLAFSPLFFSYSQTVMLEIPTLAFSLGSVFYFQRFLDGEKSSNVFLAALFCAMALLTRFDALFLFPTFLVMTLIQNQFRFLFRKESILAFLICILIVSPAYLLTILQFGHSHAQAINSGTGADSSHLLALSNFLYYPRIIPSQLGWPLTALVISGCFLLLLPSNRKTSTSYIAMIVGTYLTFSPMAELEARHAIYWIPALSVCAALVIAFLWKNQFRLLAGLLGSLCLFGTAYGTINTSPQYVRGYSEAATYVLSHTQTSPYCLFDNYLNGNFIYQIRTHDPERKLGVLRGDKLFYGVLSDPHAAYKEFAHGTEDILSKIYAYDPEYIVTEDPQMGFVMPMAERLREILHDSTSRFKLEKSIPLQTNRRSFQGISLLIYRNLLRNPNPSRLESLEMVGLGRPLKAHP